MWIQEQVAPGAAGVGQSRYDFGKSARSGTGGCVEVAFVGARAACVRDSKNPASPVLIFAPHEWEAFIEAVKAGQFDFPLQSEEGVRSRAWS